MTDAIERLAEHVVGTSFEDISGEAIVSAKTFILDTFGVAIAGSVGPFVPELIESARGWGDGDAAAVWGTDLRLSAPSAALINAYQGHNSEFDAIHERAVIHPLASILASLVAVAERGDGLSGRDLLTSAVLGVDVSCSIGMGATETLKFFRPATAGSFGAVAALGKAYGLNANELISSFGIQLGQIGGTMQAHEEGSPLLGMQLGFCTRAAVTSHDLAAKGLNGSRNVLEGNYGYYALFEGGADIEAGLAGLGTDWRVRGISHKPFPSGRATHGVIDGLLTLRAEHGIEAGDVERVRAEVPPLVYQLTGRPMITNPGVNYARLCIPYVGAVALMKGTVGIEDFGEESLRDKNIQSLAERFEVTVRDVGDPNALTPQQITIRTKDGSEYSVQMNEVIGSPAKPLSRERHLEKFRRNWISGARPLDPIRGERMIEWVDSLEDLEDCTSLVDLMTAT
jgi:aconitate decarboxylase